MLVRFTNRAIKLFHYCSIIDYYGSIVFDLHITKSYVTDTCVSMLFVTQVLAYNFVHCEAKF